MRSGAIHLKEPLIPVLLVSSMDCVAVGTREIPKSQMLGFNLLNLNIIL